jgi:hypothetical protein
MEKTIASQIEEAVLPLKADAIERAGKEAVDIIDRVRNKIEKAGFDLNVCAPFPKTFDPAYRQKHSKYILFNSLTRTRKSCLRGNEPRFADIDQNKVALFVEQSKTSAAVQYDAFVAKLSKKIGPVTAASLAGNHVWGFSILTVTKPNGEKENWKTQMIVNVSKLGTLFNQWPTRKIKKPIAAKV